MIQVTIEGRLTAQPEVRFSQAGKPWATFTIVSNERRQNQAGDWEDTNTTFLRAKMFGQKAEALAGLDKGELVIASGKLVQNDFEDKDGNRRTSYDLIISSIGRVVRNAQPAQNANAAPAGGSGAASWGTNTPGTVSGAHSGSQPQTPQSEIWGGAPTDTETPF